MTPGSVIRPEPLDQRLNLFNASSDYSAQGQYVAGQSFGSSDLEVTVSDLDRTQYWAMGEVPSVGSGRTLGNSLIVGVVSTLITLVLGCMAAYGLVRFRFKGRKTIAYTTLLLRTVPLAVLAVPVFMLWSQTGLINSLPGLILLYVAVNLPFTIWLLYGFVLQVPPELEESAAIDGCGPIQVFYKVVLPLIKPGLAAAAIFTFRIAWNEFILALVLTDRATRTLPVAASLYITDIGVDWGKIMALGSLIAIPPLIFTFVAARQIITGLTAGAVKG